MNGRLIGYILGSLCLLCAATMLPSLGIALFGEESVVVQRRMAGVFGGVILL